MGARDQDIERAGYEWGPLPAPGRTTWMFGFALLPLILAVLPWLLGAQASDAQGAEPLEIDGDAVTRLVPTVSGAERLYVVGDAGLYRGDAAGAEWERVTGDVPAGAIAAPADDSALLLAGDAADCGRGGGGTPLSRSEDGGETWVEVPGGTGIRPLAVWGADEVALGGSCEGLQLSLDSGDSWSLVDGWAPGAEVTAFAVVTEDDGRRVLVGGTGEGGTSQLFEVDLTEPDAAVVSAPLKEYFGLGAVAGLGEQRVLAGPDGVWVSIDRGETWTLRSGGLEDVVLSVDPLREAIPPEDMEGGFGLRVLALDPASASQMAVGSVAGLYTSDSAGAEWSPVEGIEGEVTAVVVAARGGLVLVETDEGVFQNRPWDA